jgi:hypothetical protein
MGYKEAHDLYKKRYGKHIKSSWIANILSDHGKTKGKSPNRKGNYKFPCPDHVRPNLEKILKELKML